MSNKSWASELIKKPWEVGWSCWIKRNDTKSKKDKTISVINLEMIFLKNVYDIRRRGQYLFARDGSTRLNRLHYRKETVI